MAISLKCKAVFLFFLLMSILIAPVFAVSYVDLERTTVGELEIDYGYVLDFDGINDFVNCGNDVSLQSTTISVDLWINSTSSDTEVVIMKKYADNLDSYGWVLFVYGGSRIYMRGHGPTGFYSGYTLNSWQHIVGVWNGTTGIIYVNGENKSGAIVAIDNTYMGNLKIAGQTLYFTGKTDEVRIYDRVINSTEVAYSYNEGDSNIPLNQTGLVLWLRMNEGTGDTSFDETVNENDGTLEPSYPDDCPLWVENEGKPPILGSIYPENIIVSELEASYNVKLYNSSLSLICNATADSDGVANMTLPSAYRSAAFEASFRVYDDNASFLYSKWFEDVHGGDTYEIKQKTQVNIFSAILLGALVFVMAVPLGFMIIRRRR